MRAVGAAAAIALENEDRVRELQDSRERIVAAGDDERRRLERNLHDGAQQRLVSIALQLRLLRNRVGDDPAAVALSTAVSDELAHSLAELRELARGIHPSVLDHGLDGALESLIARCPVPTRLEFEPGPGLPAPVELAAYFVVVRGADQRRQVRAGDHGLGHGHAPAGPARDPDRRRRRRRRERRRRFGPARPRRPRRRPRRVAAGPQPSRARDGRDRRARRLSASLGARAGRGARPTAVAAAPELHGSPLGAARPPFSTTRSDAGSTSLGPHGRRATCTRRCPASGERPIFRSPPALGGDRVVDGWGISPIPGSGGGWDRRVMTYRTHRTSPVAGHAYTVPVVRELPSQPAASANIRTW